MKVAAAKPDGRHPARLNIPDWTDCVISGIRGLVSLYSLIGVLILLPVCAAAQAPTKRVLILSGSDPNFPGFSIITRNIVSILGGSGTRVELLYELQLGLLDLPESPASDEELAGYLKRKYADKKLDLIVSIVAPRMRILLLKDPWLFGNVPKIFYEFESEREDTNRSLGPNITGVWAKSDLDKTLELALALHPDTRKVVVVSGNGPEDNLRRERAQAEFHKYEKRAEFSYIRGNTIEELKGELAALDKRSVVIFLTFTRDKAGNRYSGPETISMIAPASNAPIYGYSGNLMGLGITGGNLLDFEGIGGRIGEMSLRVLAGERAEQIPQETAPTVMTVDWRELQRWGIDERSLPPGTVVRFRQPSFWELYKWYIIGLVAACVVEALLIAWLLINRSRRRRAEEAKNQLAAIVESSDDAILSKTPKGIITSWNAGAEKMYGYPASEIVGQHVTTLAPAELKKEVAGIMEQIQRGESVDHLETVRVTKDGRRIDVSLTISPIKDEHMMIIGASTIARDITARKKAEAEATEQRAELAHLSRVTMLGELSGSLAHELNQPLGAILRNTEAAELFLEEPSPDLEELRAILADIRKDDERAGAVIDRMRSLVKRRDIEHSRLDLNVLAREVISLVLPDADSRKVQVALEPASSLPPVLGDRVQLQQVLLNLLLNAIHAVDDCATDRRRVTVRVKPAGTRVEVVVSDTGHGIPTDKLARLFEPFFTTKPEGMGMGLPISRTIMKAHLGSIRAENDPAGGATFCLTLPVAVERSAS